MSLRQKAVRGAMWSALEKWGAQLVSTIIFLLLARLLGAEAFGLVALANVFMYFMQIFLDQGFAQAIIQKDELEPEHLDTAFWTSVLMGGVFLLVVLAGAEVVANFYNEPELAPIIRWMSISFLFLGLSSVQTAILQRNMQFKVFAARSLVATVACGIAGIGAALMGLGVWSLVIKEIVFGFISALMLWSSSNWRPRLKFSSNHFKELFPFGISVVGFNFLNFFVRRSDDMLIGYFLGPVALGYYSVAYRLLLVMIKLLTNVTNQVALPTFSRMQNDLERLRDTFYKVTRYTSLISFPAFIGMAVLAPELVQSLFGEDWIPSVPVMRILAFSGVLQSINQFNGTILVSMGKPSWRLGFQCFNVLCNVVAFLGLVRWGIVAVAIGFVIRGYLLSPFPLILTKKLIKIDLVRYLRQFTPAIFSTVIMATAIFLMQNLVNEWIHSDLLLLSLSIILGAVVYIVALFLSSPKIIMEVKEILLPGMIISR